MAVQVRCTPLMNEKRACRTKRFRSRSSYLIALRVHQLDLFVERKLGVTSSLYLPLLRLLSHRGRHRPLWARVRPLTQETTVKPTPVLRGALATSLKQSMYRSRVRLPKYNGAVTLFRALSDRDGASVLRRLVPSLTSAQHADLAARHFRLAQKHRLRWSAALDAAALHHFGRPFDIGDYRISAIGLDSFDDRFKTRARLHAHAFTEHELAARAHAYAARHFRRYH